MYIYPVIFVLSLIIMYLFYYYFHDDSKEDFHSENNTNQPEMNSIFGIFGSKSGNNVEDPQLAATLNLFQKLAKQQQTNQNNVNDNINNNTNNNMNSYFSKDIGKMVGFMDNINATDEAEKEQSLLGKILAPGTIQSGSNTEHELENNDNNNTTFEKSSGKINDDKNKLYPLTSAGAWLGDVSTILSSSENNMTEYNSIHNVTDINNNHIDNKPYSNDDSDMCFSPSANYPTIYRNNPTLIMEDKTCLGLTKDECREKITKLNSYSVRGIDRNKPINVNIGREGRGVSSQYYELENNADKYAYNVNEIIPSKTTRQPSEIDNIPEPNIDTRNTTLANPIPSISTPGSRPNPLAGNGPSSGSHSTSAHVWTSNNVDDNFNKIDVADFMKPIITQKDVKGVTNIFAPVIYIKNGKKYKNVPYEYQMNTNNSSVNNGNNNYNNNNTINNMNNRNDNLLTNQNNREEGSGEAVFNSNIVMAS